MLCAQIKELKLLQLTGYFKNNIMKHAHIRCNVRHGIDFPHEFACEDGHSTELVVLGMHWYHNESYIGRSMQFDFFTWLHVWKKIISRSKNSFMLEEFCFLYVKGLKLNWHTYMRTKHVRQCSWWADTYQPMTQHYTLPQKRIFCSYFN